MAPPGVSVLTVIRAPAIIPAAGSHPKRIEEFVGRISSGTRQVSIARMQAPAGWTEPGQTPAFDEYTVVLQGMLRVRTRRETVDVHAGQAVIARRGEWVQYSTPGAGGAEYLAVCLPAFAPETARRDTASGSEAPPPSPASP
jgi:mannose-6-phosphate isomerase-like protein (cupin superfamily)